MAELRSRKPTLREELQATILGEKRNRGREMLSRALLGSGPEGIGAADFIPILGEALGVSEAPDTQGAAVAAMPIPGSGAAAKVGRKAIRKIPIDQIAHGESAEAGGKLTWPGADDLVREYAERPTPFPPIQVNPVDDEARDFFGGAKYFVEDGSHRLEAAKLRGDKTIDVEDAGEELLNPAARIGHNQPPPEKAIAGRTEGAAPDRSQQSLVRFRPPKGVSGRFQRLAERYNNDPGLADQIRSIAKEGEDIGREWYNTEALRDRFMDALGEKEGDKAWREYLWMVGATSTGAKVPQNIRTASHYFVKAGEQPGRQGLAQIAEDLLSGKYVPPKGSGYGHKMQKNQAKNVGNVETGGWEPNTADPRLNPKPRGFTQSLLGNEANIAADKHFMRLMAMSSEDPEFLHTAAEVSKEFVDKLPKNLRKFSTKREKDGKVYYSFNAKQALSKDAKAFEELKGEPAIWADMPRDNEYGAFEKMVNDIAQTMDMTGPQLQASLWMGAAKQTGVDPTSLDTFVNLFNQRVAKAGEERGLSPDEVFKRFATRKEALAVPGMLGAGAAVGGMLANEEPATGM